MQRLRYYSSRLAPNRFSGVEHSNQPPVVHIDKGTFYRRYPVHNTQEDSLNRSLFPNLTFSIPSCPLTKEHWAIIGPSLSGKTTFLEILRGQHICIPPVARSFPFLSSPDSGQKKRRHGSPASAIQYVGFAGERGGMHHQGTRGAYLSARYESHREDTDFTVLDYLRGTTKVNALENDKANAESENDANIEKAIKDFNLGALATMPMGNLSNGQMRRARIAKALIGRPDVLLLDEPFMGLDPINLTSMSVLLYRVADLSSPRVLLTLRPQDLLPDWITHVVVLGPNLSILYQGSKAHIQDELTKATLTGGGLNTGPDLGVPISSPAKFANEVNNSKSSSIEEIAHAATCRDGLPLVDTGPQISTRENEALVEMEKVKISYGSKQVLGGWKEKVDGAEREGLWWMIRRGERWAVFGPNGSGKTTLLSLICSDHPLSYSLPIRIFGRSRLPKPGQPGISIFDIQARIGQSSPEIHAFFPRNLTLRQTIRSAWADTFLGVPRLIASDETRVDLCLKWFEDELKPAGYFNEFPLSKVSSSSRSTGWADAVRFGEAPFSSQRVALFLRAIVKSPDLVILDEAFSGMDDFVRDKCLLFLAWGERRRIKASASKNQRERIISKSDNSEAVLFRGLTQDQAFICVSHLKEEVPGVVRQWICLPDAAEGGAARFGCLKGPLEGDEDGWKKIWKIES